MFDQQERVKIMGHDIYRAGRKVGYIEGNHIYSHDGKKLAYIDNDKVYDPATNKMLYHVRENTVYDSTGSQHASASSILPMVEGGEYSDAYRVAIHYLLG